MRPPDPRADFRDDGGTPAWRANRATWNTIQPPPRGLRQRWRRLSFIQQIALILGLLALPWVALVLFLVGAAACGC